MNTVREKHIRYVGRVIATVVLSTAVLSNLMLGLVPTSSASQMSCCDGSSASHCNSRAVAKITQLPREPMCGLEQLTDDAYETVVAETNDSTQQSGTSDESYPSLNTPCATDCCAIVWSGFKRPRRDFADLIQRRAVVEDLVLFPRFQKLEIHSLASPRFNNSVPRGPPVLATA